MAILRSSTYFVLAPSNSKCCKYFPGRDSRDPLPNSCANLPSDAHWHCSRARAVTMAVTPYPLHFQAVRAVDTQGLPLYVKIKTFLTRGLGVARVSHEGGCRPWLEALGKP